MIEVFELKKKFGRKEILKNISFNIKKGEITTLLGMNGVGKSTILKIIMGLVKKDSGEVFIDGEALNIKNLDKLAFVPDVKNTYGGMNIKESFDYMECFYDKWDSKKAYKMLEEFELDYTEKIDKLSKGNLEKLKIILGFAQNADYVLMDEPFSGIDIFTRDMFLKSLISYVGEDVAILIATHEIKDIENITDRVLMIKAGIIVEDFYMEDMRVNEGISLIDKMRGVFEIE